MWTRSTVLWGLFLGLALSGIATAMPPGEGYTIEVRPVGRSPGFRSLGEVTSIDFGRVTHVGAPPVRGRRYNLDDGAALFVATVEVTVRPTASPIDAPTPLAPRLRSPRGRPLATSEPEVGFGGFVPRRVDLYASIGQVSPTVGIFVTRAGETDWDDPGGRPGTPGIPLRVTEVIPNEPVRIELGLYVPAGTSGPTSASVQFEAR